MNIELVRHEHGKDAAEAAAHYEWARKKEIIAGYELELTAKFIPVEYGYTAEDTYRIARDLRSGTIAAARILAAIVPEAIGSGVIPPHVYTDAR